MELGLACAPQEILQCVNNSSETPLEHTAATRSLHRGAGIMHQKGCSRMDLRKVKPFRRTGCPAVAWAKGVLEHPPNTEQIQGKVCVNQVNVLRMSTELSVLSPGNFTQFLPCFHKLSLLLEAAGIRMKKSISSFNPQKISVKPCTRDSLIHQRWQKLCSDFLSPSRSLPPACSTARGFSGIRRSSPFPLPPFSFTPAAIPLPLKPVSSSCQRERNDKSIQRKRKTERSQASCVT